MEKAVGVPRPPEKPREKPADAKRDILLPLLSLSPALNIQAIYDVISGKARKQKSWYKYDDLQNNINWIRERVDDDYFTKMGIPQEKISDFLQFSIGTKLEVNQGVKAKNLSKVLFGLEETFPLYLKNK